MVCSVIQNAAVLVETLLDQYTAEADYPLLLAFYRKVCVHRVAGVSLLMHTDDEKQPSFLQILRS